jgi:hypothetical protein
MPGSQARVAHLTAFPHTIAPPASPERPPASTPVTPGALLMQAGQSQVVYLDMSLVQVIKTS